MLVLKPEDVGRVTSSGLQRAETLSIEVLTGHTLESDEQNAQAGDFVRQVKELHNILDEARSEFTAPLRAAEKWVNDQFRPALTRLKDTEARLKQMIGAYAAKKAAEQRAIAARAAEQAAAAAVPQEAFVQAMQATRAAAPAPVPGVSTRMVTRFRVLDPNAVPRELCSPDMDKISAALAAGRMVPGVETYQEPVVTVRRA